jgi:hypothetical protein
MTEKIINSRNFRYNDGLAEIYILGILAIIKNKNPDLKNS